MAASEHSPVQKQLQRERDRQSAGGGRVVGEVKHILDNELLREANILKHLGRYEALSTVLQDDRIDAIRIFSREEIRQIAVNWRLKFLTSKLYRPEIPYEAVLMIKDLNREFGKELSSFFILSVPEAFREKVCEEEALLFSETSAGNYYLIHRWGKALAPRRRWLYWPMRCFENLFITVLFVTLCMVLSLPTWLITLDHKAEYWSGYRAAAFFHLLIFNMGVTTYFTFAFAKNFSATIWDRSEDF